MKFRNAPGIDELINSEGTILRLVESVDEEDFINEQLFVQGLCLKGQAKIYARVNPKSLELFFQGRLTVKELFLLRVDERFIIEYKDKQAAVQYDEDFDRNVLSTLLCGDNIYYSLPTGMRASHPFTGVLGLVERDYINGHVAVPANETTGQTWCTDHL